MKIEVDDYLRLKNDQKLLTMLLSMMTYPSGYYSDIRLNPEATNSLLLAFGKPPIEQEKKDEDER